MKFADRVRRHVPWGKDSELKILRSETMNREELIRFVEFLLKTQEDLKKSLEAANEQEPELLKQIEQMTKAQNEFLAQNASLQKSLNDLTEEIRLSCKGKRKL